MMMPAALSLTVAIQELVIPVLGSHLHVHSILLWGFIATAVLTAIMYSGQELGFSRLSIPYALGTMFTRSRRRARAIGFVVHFVNGWMFALLYALVFEDLGFATWWLGAPLGLIHGLLVLTVAVPLLPAIHPRMADEQQGPTPNRWLQPPGFMGLNYGHRTPLLTLLAHIPYGTIMGAGAPQACRLLRRRRRGTGQAHP